MTTPGELDFKSFAAISRGIWSALQGASMKHARWGVLSVSGFGLIAGCYAAEPPFDDGGSDGVSARINELTVGGYRCPTSGEIAGRTVPSDGQFYVTTFGGGSDTQRMACGGSADGRWLYIADSWRFGCGARVRVTNPTTGRWCVAQVADVGPNICVERRRAA